jgi:hypothetical protein
MQDEGNQFPIWRAGEVVPAGTYARIDDQSYRLITLPEKGPLPASFDGHIAWYRIAAKVSLLSPQTETVLLTLKGK